MEYFRLPIANPSIVFREEFDDWALLFDPDTGESYGINPVGAYIWKNLKETKNFPELVDDLQSQFDDVPENAPEDIAKFINELVDKGFAGYEIRRQ